MNNNFYVIFPLPRGLCKCTYKELKQDSLNVKFSNELILKPFAGFHMTPKLAHIFPESCLLIVVGILIGFLLFLTTDHPPSTLTPDVFFLYMLPPIILVNIL